MYMSKFVYSVCLLSPLAHYTLLWNNPIVIVIDGLSVSPLRYNCNCLYLIGGVSHPPVTRYLRYLVYLVLLYRYVPRVYTLGT
ncbi:hypothetical protein GGR58DRAFT_489301 [Xylaria digitata]|nr:hypothetical protein GGR58DRAFT_489301 [Xylaria digitata]